jgi:glycine oxidase
VKSWDVIVLGCGVIGASLARELHKSGASVLVIERGEPGREASHAAAGMLAPFSGEMSPDLIELAVPSARMYPEWGCELEDEAIARSHDKALRIDMRGRGTIVLGKEAGHVPPENACDESEQREIEPYLVPSEKVAFACENSVDPRGLMDTLLRCLKHRGVAIAHGAGVKSVEVHGGSFEVETGRARYLAARVVNCCGAWAGEITAPFKVPARPRKGQMLSVIPRKTPLLRHVIRSEEIYLVPRTDGRILIGATVEDCGFDKQVIPETIKHMQKLAERIVPALADARIHEMWAGLRPGTPDDLPILGESSVPGYFIATGHFRNGILLAPVTAQIMSQLLRGEAAAHPINAFSPARFA